MVEKKDAFEEAVEILKSYQEGLPEMKVEACCSLCDVKKKKKVIYEAEF